MKPTLFSEKALTEKQRLRELEELEQKFIIGSTPLSEEHKLLLIQRKRACELSLAFKQRVERIEKVIKKIDELLAELEEEAGRK